jgi:hypothetical protein
LKALEFITNSTNEFAARKLETQATLDMVNSVIASAPAASLKGAPAVDKRVSRALTTMQAILSQRLLDLDMAIDNSTTIISSIQSQLNILKLDTSLLDDGVGNGTGLSSNDSETTTTTTTGPPGPKKSVLSDCADASIELFASMSCAACNPSFSDKFMKSDSESNGMITNLDVSTSVCTSLFKKCAPTIRDSRRYLRQALSVMRKLQFNLARTAARTQPILLALWSLLIFDWLPGSSRPLASYQTNEDTFAPDITSLDCISNTKLQLPPVTQVNDFCNAFFGQWNYHTTINGMMKDIDAGIVAYQSLGRCDLCIHTIVSKLSEIFANGVGGIDVTMALNPEALAQAGCVGLSSTPAKKLKSQESSSSSPTSQGMMSGTVNFFAIQPGELWSSRDAESEISRKSIRAISMIMNASKLRLSSHKKSSNGKTKRMRLKDALNGDDIDELSIASPPLFIPSITFSDSGVDPLVLANVSWATIENITHSPPPPMWALRYSSEVGIVASSINCTSHASCNPDSGDTPYWFCATSKVCNGTIPCDETEAIMLEAAPKCVKGICVDDATAVDGKCPDVATCPITKSGQFDHTYFARFKSIAPVPAPEADLVATEGVTNAMAISQAMNYVKGVCDCAFLKETNSLGGASLVVGDRCKFAQCLAYAQSVEPSLTCSAGLSKRCSDFQEECPGLECDAKRALWDIPTCTVTNPVDGSGFISAAESTDRDASILTSTFAIVLVAVVSLALI